MFGLAEFQYAQFVTNENQAFAKFDEKTLTILKENDNFPLYHIKTYYNLNVYLMSMM